VTINPLPLSPRSNAYPTADGKPMAETDFHRDLMLLLIEVLRAFYAGQQVYVTGNILVFYQPGNRRRHLSPDVWLARGVEHRARLNYLIWEEPKGPEFVIELTSSSTRTEDLVTKFTLYRDVLKVREYFLFDPLGDYLDEQLQGYRLRKGAYQRIHARDGRLPSQVTGLHLEATGDMLRLWNPLTQNWLPTPAERIAQAQQRAEHEATLRLQAEQHAHTAEQHAHTAEQHAHQVEEENRRLREQIEALQRQLGGNP
jgi:Uma2 family endonuclease